MVRTIFYWYVNNVSFHVSSTDSRAGAEPPAPVAVPAILGSPEAQANTGVYAFSMPVVKSEIGVDFVKIYLIKCFRFACWHKSCGEN